ncbi:MAG TPA: hypothetical protein VKA87_10055, partial [Nitrososphaeraceae archaeon]|nr:hypothetical protein [Nitrososphaeraceae archaeon]
VSADETATIQLTVKDLEGATNSTTVEIAVNNAVATPRATTLTLNTITSVPWGNDITVTGKLTDNAGSGASVGGATITFDATGADNLPDVVTNADGTFTAKGASPANVATGWIVQAHFEGNLDYIASNSLVKSSLPFFALYSGIRSGGDLFNTDSVTSTTDLFVLTVSILIINKDLNCR